MLNGGKSFLLITATSSEIFCSIFLCLHIFDGTWGTPYVLSDSAAVQPTVSDIPLLLELNSVCALTSIQKNTASSVQAIGLAGEGIAAVE